MSKAKVSCSSLCNIIEQQPIFVLRWIMQIQLGRFFNLGISVSFKFVRFHFLYLVVTYNYCEFLWPTKTLYCRLQYKVFVGHKNSQTNTCINNQKNSIWK